MLDLDMAENKNVFIYFDESEMTEANSAVFEDYLSSISEEAIFIRSEDNKGIFMTEDGDAFLIQEHF